MLPRKQKQLQLQTFAEGNDIASQVIAGQRRREPGAPVVFILRAEETPWRKGAWILGAQAMGKFIAALRETATRARRERVRGRRRWLEASEEITFTFINLSTSSFRSYVSCTTCGEIAQSHRTPARCSWMKQ
jgi:hypothetical protein